MKNILLAIALTIVPALAPAFAPAYSQGVQGLASATVELPYDADRMYLTLFDDGSESAEAVRGWFDGSLLDLRQRTRYQRIHCSTPMYQKRYSENDGIAIKLQTPDSEIVSEVRYDELPMTDAALRERIRTDCQRWRLRNCPDGQCKPAPKAEPAPRPEPAPEPKPVPRPEIQPSPQAKPMNAPIWLYCLAAIGGIVVGVVESYIKTHKGA